MAGFDTTLTAMDWSVISRIERTSPASGERAWRLHFHFALGSAYNAFDGLYAFDVSDPEAFERLIGDNVDEEALRREAELRARESEERWAKQAARIADCPGFLWEPHHAIERPSARRCHHCGYAAWAHAATDEQKTALASVDEDWDEEMRS